MSLPREIGGRVLHGADLAFLGQIGHPLQAWNQFEPSSKGFACDWTDAAKGEKYKL